MSRSRAVFPPKFAVLALAICAVNSLHPAKVIAQDQGELTAEQVTANARTAYGPLPPEPKCAPQNGDEIVVCAEEEDQAQFRVKSSSELDPTSEEAIDDGLPRAPDVGGPGIFKGKPTISGLCFIPPCPKDPAYIVDFAALPDTPEGSDADRVGKGLAPNGGRVSPQTNEISTGGEQPEE